MHPRKSLDPRAPRRRTGALDWAIHADTREVLDALASGRHRESLREYFGAEAFDDLAVLAAAAKKVRHAGAHRVLIVPGMMRSRLGEVRRGEVRRGGAARRASRAHHLAETRLLWIDPEHIAAGRLMDLALSRSKSIRTMGVPLSPYARLKLTLDIAGFDADFFPYDWRLGLDELGKKLAGRIAAEDRPISIVSHSMGGLIARVALREVHKFRVRKLIMLGTPSRGCFVPVQALRGTHPLVQNISRLDRRNSSQRLAARVFSTFPGLYHLLPARGGRSGLDLFDPRSWPSEGPRPEAVLLAQAASARNRMARPDSRMAHIVGVNRETVVAVRRTAHGFEYASSSNGDGTVPVALAIVSNLKTYFVDEAHGNLANNPLVLRAIVDLLGGGSTRRLTRRFVPSRARLTRTDDERLSAAVGGKFDWRRLPAAQRQAVFAELDGGRPAK